jgi:hypothetical protein
MKVNLTTYSPSFERATGVANEDADSYLQRLVSEPCGTDGLTFSTKSGNSSAKSLAHAGKLVVSSLTREVNDRNKRNAFEARYPNQSELIEYDQEVAERYKAFTDFTRTTEEIEVCNLLNSERKIPADTRDKCAKHVAAIGGYTALLTQDVAEKFASFALNYWISKNPILRLRIEQSVDRPKSEKSA